MKAAAFFKKNLKLALVLLTRYFVFVHYPTFFENFCCLLCKLSIHGLLICYFFFQQLTQFLDKSHDFTLYWFAVPLLNVYTSVYTCPSLYIVLVISFFRHIPSSTFPKTSCVATRNAQFCCRRRVRTGRRQGYQEGCRSYVVFQLPFPGSHKVIILSRKVRNFGRYKAMEGN